MSGRLELSLTILSFLLVLLTTYFLKKGRIPEKYALLWYSFSILILIISFFPGIFTILANILGFQLLSNMVLVLLVGILFLLTMSLTIMIAGQKKKTTLLIQEVSILNERLKKYEGSKKW